MNGLRNTAVKIVIVVFTAFALIAACASVILNKNTSETAGYAPDVEKAAADAVILIEEKAAEVEAAAKEVAAWNSIKLTPVEIKGYVLKDKNKFYTSLGLEFDCIAAGSEYGSVKGTQGCKDYTVSGILGTNGGYIYDTNSGTLYYAVKDDSVGNIVVCSISPEYFSPALEMLDKNCGGTLSFNGNVIADTSVNSPSFAEAEAVSEKTGFSVSVKCYSAPENGNAKGASSGIIIVIAVCVVLAAAVSAVLCLMVSKYTSAIASKAKEEAAAEICEKSASVPVVKQEKSSEKEEKYAEPTVIPVSVSESTAVSGEADTYKAQLEELARESGEAAERLTEIRSEGRNISSAISEAADGLEKTAGILDENRERSKELIAAADEITDQSKKIREIIAAIEDVAFQTNMLALNAAIEAARAGENGKGFAVVADEVRNLALKSSESAKSSAEIIDKTVISVERSAALAEQTVQLAEKAAESAEKTGVCLKEAEKSAAEQDRLAEKAEEELRKIQAQ